jgi:two-component system phosphate regulon sensor histidine kinase PhoR
LAPDSPLALFDDLGVGMLRLGQNGRIELANRTAGQLIGVPGLSLVGRNLLEAFVDHRVEELAQRAGGEASAQLELSVGTDPRRTLLLRARRADGTTWLLIEDLTELRRLQRIRTEFVDNLSHELRTPLTTVRLLTESLTMELERTELPPRVRELIEKIDVESGHLAQMVSELLDLAKIEQGEAPLRMEQVDLGTVITSAIDRLRLYAERQGVNLRSEAPDEPTERTLTGDAERLEQLLINLLHNAVKFSPEGGDVTVHLSSRDEELLVEVEDHGVGIPRADLDRIFERFYKVDRARVRGGGGTGLGLAIARHIVAGHGGRIWAESDEGAGSKFSVILPGGSARRLASL